MKLSLKPMTTAELEQYVPAAFSKKPQNHLSDRYGFFNTANILDALRGEGFLPVRARQDRAQKRDPNFVRHAVSLVHQSALASRPVMLGEAVPTIEVINSHNGRTKFSVQSGVFRLICLNGMMVAEKGTDQFDALRHSANLVAEVIGRVKHVASSVDKTVKLIEHWRNVELDDEQMISFAGRAAALRFGEAGSGYPVGAILEAKRVEDEGRNVWRVMNRIQENLMRGGIAGISDSGRRVMSRPIHGITADIAFNRALWALTEEVAA